MKNGCIRHLGTAVVVVYVKEISTFYDCLPRPEKW